MSKGFASNYRVVLLATGVFACFGTLASRLVWLQVVGRDKLLDSIAETRRQVIVEKAVRGNILDAHGAILATSRAVIVVGVDPTALRTPKDKHYASDRAKWPQLATLLGMPLAQLEGILTTAMREAAAGPSPVPASTISFSLPSAAALAVAKPADKPAPGADAGYDPDENDGDTTLAAGRWIKLSEGITQETLAAITDLKINGIYSPPPHYRRVYPHKQLGAHVLGFVNRQEEAVSGIERYADFYLHGQDGWREGERDGRHRELAQFRTRDVQQANGYSVKLSIDNNVQDIIEQEIAHIAEKYQPLKATIIVSDPRDGFILGLANYPSFDPNDYNSVPKEELARLKNVAVADVYEPGSVFKIVAASGALEQRLVTPETSFDCSLTKIEYKGKVRGLPKEDHNFGQLTVAEIIAHSSNRGAAQLAMQLGEQRFYEYAQAFGFGSRTGLPGDHEEPGLMPPPSKWDGLTITRMPMGQSVAVTVMQMHQAMSVIASGGVRLQPQIIREIYDSSGAVVYRFDREEKNRVVSTATARTMARLLMGVASAEGTAPTAAIPGYEVAGKTGTTQKLEPVTLSNGTTKLEYSTRHHVASFVGFFPATRPQIVISVVVDDADAHAENGVAYGRDVAAPSFKRIGEQLISYRDIKTGTVPAPNLIAMGGSRR